MGIQEIILVWPVLRNLGKLAVMSEFGSTPRSPRNHDLAFSRLSILDNVVESHHILHVSFCSVD
jgi:hypothetical protein